MDTHPHTEREIIVRNRERLLVFMLSIPDTSPHTPIHEALVAIYAEALRAGAGKYTRETFLHAENLLGTHISVSCGGGKVHISFQAVDTYVPGTLLLFESMLHEPHFAKNEIARIVTHLTHLLTLAKEDARARAYHAFVNSLVPKDDPRFAHRIDEQIEALTKVTPKMLQDFHTQIQSAPWRYTCGGNEKSTTLVVSRLERIRKKNPVLKGNESPHTVLLKKERTVSLCNIPHKQNIELSIGGALPITRSDKTYAAFMFGINVLGFPGGFNGRLMSTVREKEGLTYSIYARTESVTTHDQGFWRISTFFTPKDAVRGITATLREITRMYEKGITEGELAQFKTILGTRRKLLKDSLIRQVADVHAQREAGIDAQMYDTFIADIETLTKKQVDGAMKQFLDPKQLTISGAGPVQKVKKDLLAFSN